MGWKIKAERYIEICKKTFTRKTRYENSPPWNCGYYDGEYLYGDCWCFNPKVILWSESIGQPVCDNFTRGKYYYLDGIQASGMPDTTGDVIMANYCTQVSFAKMLQDKIAPCLLLITNAHMGAYIGDYVVNGYTYNVCEFSPNENLRPYNQGLKYSYVDANGARRVCKDGAILGYWSKAGYLTSFVDYTNTVTLNPIEKVTNKLSASALADAIIAKNVHGRDVGNGQDRINNLKTMGYTEAEIKAAQEIINQKFAIAKKLTSEQLADAILAGSLNGKQIGNGITRINNLKAAGYTETEIRAAQDIVNERLIGKAPTVQQPDTTTARKTIAQNMKTVQKGSTGETVELLQKVLKSLGFYTGNIDGKAGNYTVDAIKKAQTTWGIIVDGIFGPQSWNKLLEV